MMRLGIDEAGRGPVIGSMFVAGVLLSKEAEERLVEIGVRDSKSLTPKRRMKLLPIIFKEAKAVAVIERRPWEIDSVNINKLYIDSVISILSLLRNHGYAFNEVLIDSTSSRNELINKVMKSVSRGVKVIVEDKADAKYPVVSAASIVAKCLRDTHITYLHLKYGDFGSGYPTDPKTVKWLSRFKSMSELPPIVRRSWGTLKRLGISVSDGEGILKWLRIRD